MLIPYLTLKLHIVVTRSDNEMRFLLSSPNNKSVALVIYFWHRPGQLCGAHAVRPEVVQYCFDGTAAKLTKIPISADQQIDLCTC